MPVGQAHRSKRVWDRKVKCFWKLGGLRMEAVSKTELSFEFDDSRRDTHEDVLHT